MVFKEITMRDTQIDCVGKTQRFVLSKKKKKKKKNVAHFCYEGSVNDGWNESKIRGGGGD
jgi:hypothetical protein